MLTRLTIFTTFRRQKPDHRPLVVVVVTHTQAYQSVNKKLTKTYKTLVKLIKHVKHEKHALAAELNLIFFFTKFNKIIK